MGGCRKRLRKIHAEADERPAKHAKTMSYIETISSCTKQQQH